MKSLKLALLGTAVLAAGSVSARADTLADLKSAILGIDNTFVSATADVPVAGPSVVWSGFVRAAVVSRNGNEWLPNLNLGFSSTVTSFTVNTIDFKGRGELNVVAKTDTSVGEVGVAVGVRSDLNNSVAGAVSLATAKGWWKLTPNMTLTAGWIGTPGNVGGFGGDTLTAIYSGGVVNPSGSGDATGFALGYSDGPISMNVGVSSWGGNNYAFGADASYSSDGYSAKVGAWSKGAEWQAGLGLTASMDMVTLTAAGAMGHGDNIAPAVVHFLTDYWVVSAAAKAKLGDSLSAEIGAGYRADASNIGTRMSAAGGIYYTPVSQLTIGLEAGYNVVTLPVSPTTSVSAAATTIDLVTVFKF